MEYPESASIWSAQYRGLTVGMLLALSLTAFESLAVSAAMPKIAVDLNGLTLYGWVFSLFQLSNILGIFWAGQTSDRRGPAFPFLVALTVFAIGLLCSSTAQGMPQLLLGRALQGWGAGVIATVIYVAIQLVYPLNLRPTMLASLATAWILPTLIGPLLASYLAEALTWRAVFWVLLPLLVPVFALTLPALRRIQSEPHLSRNTLPQAAVLALGTTLLIAGLGSPKLQTIVLLLAGLLLVVYSFPRLFPAGIFRLQPGVPAGIALRSLIMWAFVGFEAFLPLGLTELRGVSLKTAALCLMMGSLSWSGGTWIQARLEALHGRSGRVLRVRLGFSLLLLGCLVAALAILPLGLWVGLAGVGWMLAGLGIGICFAAITLEVMDSAKPEEKGATSSWLQCGDVLAGALSAGVVGAVLAWGQGLGLPRANSFALLFLLLLLAPAVGVMAARRLQPSR